MAVSIQEYQKALAALKEAVGLWQTNVPEAQKRAFRDAAIQRFEFCMELAWKTAKKTMGSPSTAPKTVIREMAQNQLIDDPEPWFEFLEARNLTSHTYNESVANQVFAALNRFLPQGLEFLEKLRKK